MNVRELVNEAYYIANVNSAQLQTLTGEQLTRGVNILNRILSGKSAKFSQIPYITRHDFACVVDQEEYFVDNLASVETFTVSKGDVRYNMTPISREKYFGDFRVNNISSLPLEYYVERGMKNGTPGMRIFVYYEPSLAEYEFNVVGKMMFQSVTANTVIPDTLELEGYYIDYLTYELARRLCSFYKIPFDPQDMLILEELRDNLTDANQFDPTVHIMNQFPAQEATNWARVNFPSEYSP